MRSKVLMALLVGTIGFAGCGGSSPTAPDKTPVVQPPAQQTISISGLSAEMQAYLLDMSTAALFRNAEGTIMIRRWADRTTPIRVHGGGFSVDAVEKAFDLVKATFPLSLSLVRVDSVAEAEIVLKNELPVTSATACGSGTPNGAPEIVSGLARVGIGLRKGCEDNGDYGVIAIAHEITHVLGLGHTSGCNDYMSGTCPVYRKSDFLVAAASWVYDPAHKPGTIVTQ